MQIERVGGALLLLGPDKDGAYVPAAVWPHAGRDMQYLSPAAERALTERRGILVTSDGVTGSTRDQRTFIGYPIEVSGVLHGAVVLDIAPSPEPALQRALRLLHWASAWLIDQLRNAKERYGLEVTVIDYRPAAERDAARATAARIAELGFEPWVTDPMLTTLVANLLVLAVNLLALLLSGFFKFPLIFGNRGAAAVHQRLYLLPSAAVAIRPILRAVSFLPPA